MAALEIITSISFAPSPSLMTNSLYFCFSNCISYHVFPPLLHLLPVSRNTEVCCVILELPWDSPSHSFLCALINTHVGACVRTYAHTHTHTHTHTHKWDLIYVLVINLIF